MFEQTPPVPEKSKTISVSNHPAPGQATIPSPLLVDVWLDFNSPDCFFSFVHLKAALEKISTTNPELTIVLSLHPFLTQTDTDCVAPIKISAAKHEEFTHLGIPLAQQVTHSNLLPWHLIFLTRDYSDNAACGEDFRQSLQMHTCSALFRAQYEIGADLCNPETLLHVAADLDLPGKAVLQCLEDSAVADQLQQEFSTALHLGVTSPPTVLLDEKIVMGPRTSPAHYERALLEVINAYHTKDSNDD